MARDALGGAGAGPGRRAGGGHARLGAVAVAASLVGRSIVAIGFLFLVIPGIVGRGVPDVHAAGGAPRQARRRPTECDGASPSSRRTSGPSSALVVGSLLVLVGAGDRGVRSSSLRTVPRRGWPAFMLHGAAVSYLTVVGVHVYRLLRGPGTVTGAIAREESLEARRARARSLIRHLERAYPDAACALRFTTPLELARRHDPGGPVHGRAREPGDRSPVREVPPRGGLRPRRPGDLRSGDPLDRLLPGQDPIGPRHGAGARRAARRRGAADARGPDGAARRRAARRRTCVLGNAFDVPGIAVDTHVFRVTQRLGPREGRRSRRRGGPAGARSCPAPQWTPLLPPHPGPRPPGVPRPTRRAPPVRCGRSAPGPGRPAAGARRVRPRRRAAGVAAPSSDRAPALRAGRRGVSGVDTPGRLR